MDALFGASDPSMVSIVPPRGRTYARNGAIVDLQIEPGRVTAIVSGSDIYEIAIEIDRLDRKVWKRIVRECTGQIGSMVELLQGRFSDEVMRILARPRTGLFSSPKQIRLSEPEIFFALRQVDQTELIGEAATAKRLGTRKRVGKRTLANADLEGVFGIELDRPRRR